MRNVRKLIKKVVNFCKKSFGKDLKSVLLYGSSVKSISKAKDIDLIIVVDERANKENISKEIDYFIHHNTKSNRNDETVGLPFTEIHEQDFFNILVVRESDIKSKNMGNIFGQDKLLVSFFVPSSLVLLSLKENHKILFGKDETKSWKIEIGFLDYIKTLTRSLSLSAISLILLPISISKSFSLSCDSLKHMLQNVFILENKMVAKDTDALLDFYKPSWWVETLSKHRSRDKISIFDKILFILSLPVIIVTTFAEMFI